LVFFPSHGPWCEIHGQQLTLCIQSARRDEAPPELAIEPPAWASTSHLLSANIPWFLVSLLTKDRGIEVRKNPCLSSRYDRMYSWHAMTIQCSTAWYAATFCKAEVAARDTLLCFVSSTRSHLAPP
jgi:hypothetical protein